MKIAAAATSETTNESPPETPTASPPEPHEEEEDDRPAEGMDALVDARGPQMHRGRSYRRPVPDQKKFTEPVALSSTRPADRPLPRRACELSFDLLALRARCKREPMGQRPEGSSAVFTGLPQFAPYFFRSTIRRRAA